MRDALPGAIAPAIRRARALKRTPCPVEWN
jgi:hypothetical protein